MDPNQDSTPKPSKRKIEAKNSAMVETKRVKFFDPYFYQNFSLPSDSIIYYIAMNPATSKLYEKMIQTCKYFFCKNPILVISQLNYFRDGNWCLSFENRPIDLSKVLSKLWITYRLCIPLEISVHNKPSVMPNLYRCDAKSVFIGYQIISFHDMSFLISGSEDFYFDNITVKNDDGINVVVEKNIEVAVKAKEIHLQSFFPNLNITSNTMKELLKIPHFLKLDEFSLGRIPEAFDLETFYIYMKQNKTTKLYLSFDESISEAYKNRLQDFVNEILETETHDYNPPLIEFHGHHEEKYSKLRDICDSD